MQNGAIFDAKVRAKELFSQGEVAADVFVDVIAEAGDFNGRPITEQHKRYMRVYLTWNELALHVNDVVVAIASSQNLAKWAISPRGTELPQDVKDLIASLEDPTIELVVTYMEFISKTAPIRQREIYDEVKVVPGLMLDQVAFMKYVLDNYS